MTTHQPPTIDLGIGPNVMRVVSLKSWRLCDYGSVLYVTIGLPQYF